MKTIVCMKAENEASLKMFRMSTHAAVAK